MGGGERRRSDASATAGREERRVERRRSRGVGEKWRGKQNRREGEERGIGRAACTRDLCMELMMCV